MKTAIAVLFGVAALGAAVFWTNQQPAQAQDTQEARYSEKAAKCILENMENAHIERAVRVTIWACESLN